MAEAEYEPGSRKRVLKNLLGIKTKREINKIEWETLRFIQNKLIDTYTINHRFSSADIQKMHKLWLKEIYSWAGHYREVNMSKGGFHFSVVKHIPSLMKKFEKEFLNKYTPCIFENLEEVISAIAIVHTELVLIHPFREGNGRLARLLAGFMAMQAGLPMLDFSFLAGKHFKYYVSAIHAGLDNNYEPMKKIFRVVVERTLGAFS